MTTLPTSLRMMNEFYKLSDIDVLRVTGVQVFERCPYNWALQFLRPEEKQKSSVSANIGTAAHAIIEDVVHVLQGRDPADTAKHWLKIPEAEQQPLLDYVAGLADWKIQEVLAVEHEFTLEVSGMAKPIRGHMDLVVRLNDGSLAIVDHKTNRAFDGVGYWRAQMQPLLYSWAARQLWPSDVTRFRIGYVNLGTNVDWVTDPAEDAHVEERMRMNWRRMLRYDAAGVWPMSVNDHCKWCAISTVCPEHQGAIETFKTSLEDKLFKATVGEKLAFVKTILKLAEDKKAELEAALKADIASAPGRAVVHGGVEYTLATPSVRALAANEAIHTFIKWSANATPEETDKALGMLGDLFTAKVTGVDKIAKELPSLGEALAAKIRKEDQSPRIKARPLTPAEKASPKMIE